MVGLHHFYWGFEFQIYGCRMTTCDLREFLTDQLVAGVRASLAQHPGQVRSVL